LASACAAVGLVAPVAAQPGVTAPVEPEIEADSASGGYADSGTLQDAFVLRSNDVLVTVRPHTHGTRELVGLLERAAEAVAREAAGSRLAVGDLSAPGGGPLTPHDSHQSGRDADLGFYMIEDGKPLPQAMFQRVRQDGSALRGERRFVFDDGRNWSLLVALVDDPTAEVQYVMLAPHIRARLLVYARAIGASDDQVRRVEVVTAPMRDSDAHDKHFHVRIYCSVGDRPQCLDRPPLHPWYYGTPSPGAVAAVRMADRARAVALRRQRKAAREADERLARGHAEHIARERLRAQDLLVEQGHQRQQERLRAVKLTRDERDAVRQMRRAEREARRRVGPGDSALVAQERRWQRAERRRARTLRAAIQRLEAEERRRVAEMQRQARRASRRAEAQQRRDRRRAELLLRRGERLQRERERATRQQ